MSFKGDLSTIGLGEVFQMISMSQKEGTLIVQDTESRKCVFFGVSGVQLLSSGRRKGMKVGDMLVRAGKVTEEQLADALENGRIQKKKIGEVLVESGVVSEDEIKKIVREQIEEEIYDLFLWKKADFEFVEGPAAEELKDPDAQVTTLSFDVNGLLLEAVRRADEWAIINQSIPSIDSIFTFVSESDRHEEDKAAGETAKRVFSLVDGRTPISEIVENTGISKFETCKVLVDLYNRGRIRILTVPETMELALKRMAEGNRERGMRMYLAAAAQAPTDAKVLSQVAKFLEGEGLGKEAASYHVKAGHIFLEQGDLDRAMDHMQRAAGVNPDDLSIQMGLFEVHAAAGNLDEGKKLAKDLVVKALMAPDLPRARALCDRILNADANDMEFRVFRAKALHRANLKKELQDDLDFIKKNMPVDPGEAEKIDRELREIVVKRPSTVQQSKPGSGVAPTLQQAKAPKTGGGGKIKIALAAAFGLVLIAGGAFVYLETSARGQLDRAIEESNKQASKYNFAEARRGIDAFIATSLSPGQKDRAQTQLKALEERQQNWERNKKAEAEENRRKALEQMKALAEQIEDERQNRPSVALQKARELRDMAEANKDPEYMKKADDLIQVLEKYVGDAFNLKARADSLEKEGKFRDAALLIDRLLSEYPNTDPARNALYPIEIATRPSGVKVTSVRSNMTLGETVDGPIKYRMKPTEAVQLLCEKQGYASVKQDVKDKSVGRIQVDLVEKRVQWFLPLGVSVSSEPAVLGDNVFATGGSRITALKASTNRMDWYEPLDGPVEGGVKVGAERIYLSTTAQTLYAIDPKLKDKHVAWRYEAGERISGTPGLSADGGVVYVGTYDRNLHAVKAATGEGLWRREMPAEVRLEPLPSEQGIIAACTDGTIMEVRGQKPEDEVWRFKMDGAPGSMILAEGTLYISGSDQTLYAIDPKKGTKLWRRVMPSLVTGRIARSGATVCAAVRDGKVHFLDAATGDSLWTYEAQGPIQGGVSVMGSLVLFGSDDQSVYAFDLSFRALAWKLKVKGKVRLAPAAGKGAAFIGNDEGIYAVELN